MSVSYCGPRDTEQSRLRDKVMVPVLVCAVETGGTEGRKAAKEGRTRKAGRQAGAAKYKRAAAPSSDAFRAYFRVGETPGFWVDQCPLKIKNLGG